MGSVTKPFTAVAVLQLYELGLLDIDLPISTYVDEILMRDNGTTLLEIWNNDTIINNVRSSLSSWYYRRQKWQASVVCRRGPVVVLVVLVLVLVPLLLMMNVIVLPEL